VTRDEPVEGVRIGVLGPLRLEVDGAEVDVPGPRRRAVLALLVLAGGRTVSVDALLDAVWPDAAPDSGRRALHSHVSRLRGHLGRHGDVLARDGNGYRMRAEHLTIDVAEMRAAAARARAVVATDPAETARQLSDALEHWRGTALEEFAEIAPLAADGVALAALRADLHDEWFDARLASGGDRGLVADVTRAVAEEPQRERTAALLVRALAIEGRQSEAMRAAHDFRRRLADETGFDPSQAFAALEHDVASGAMGPPAPTVPAAPDLPATAPDLAATAAAGHPRRARPATPLVGRERELGRVLHELERAQLVTIVGPGGVGKTRLALEAAAELDQQRPVHHVELATIDDGRHTLDALGAALGLRAPDHASLRDAAVAVLAARPALLVVDNCEHLVDACRELVGALLASVPALTVLTTSREPLDHPAEHLVRLGPLPVPDADASIAEIIDAPAVAAFLTHARRRLPDFEVTDATAAAVGEIVRRLDGLPLALELAAGRVGTLGIDDVRDRLGRALDLLGRGRSTNDTRHRTLRSTIDWSYQLLDSDERALLRAMAVFPGGLDLSGVERLGEHRGIESDAAVMVARLADASVVVADTDQRRTRFRMLETVRAFALDDLGARGERSRAEDHLVAAVLELAAELSTLGHGPMEGDANERLALELPNIRAARDVSAARGDVGAQLTLLRRLQDLAIYRSFPELHAWTTELGALALSSPHLENAVPILGLAARSAWLRGELDRAAQFGARALEIADDESQLVDTYDALGIVALFQGDFERAEELQLRAAALSTPTLRAVFLPTASLAATYAGRTDRASELLAQGRVLSAQTGSPGDVAYARYCEAELLAQQDLDAAVVAYEDAIEGARTVGASFVEGIATVGLVSAWGRKGRLAEALVGYRWLVDYWRRAGNWTQLWTTLRNLARALADADDPQCSAFVLAAAEHAEGAATIDATTEAELATLRDELEARLGGQELERIQGRARALSRSTVVDEALEAVDAALR
jgi:predicted ATPase/DNA-binding SARP family transcriptional activator